MATLYNNTDLNKIKLECDYESTVQYKDPIDMIDPLTGKKNYAYVTLVMLGDLYVSAAIVLAYSLRKLNTKSDLVVLVTNDVSESGKHVLGIFFDHVIEVEYIHVRNWRTKKQPSRKYLDYVFTKFHVFNLTQYKKILLIDADALVLKYPDHLFSLNAPAGCYLKNKDLFISYDSEGNYVLPTDKKIKWYTEYCECCGHGKIIPKSETDLVLKDKTNSGIGGGLILLEPKKGELDNILQDVTKGKGWSLVNNFFVWPEQQYLTQRYSGKWTSINPRFFGLQGYPHWEVLYGLQYGGDKPFVKNSKFPIDIRIQYPDYILWHQFFKKILLDNPILRDEKSLSEAIEMNQYFKIDPARNVYNNDIETIKSKLNISPKRDHVEYYYLDETKNYMPIKLNDPLFADISEFDYLTPINKLSEYFSTSESNYYKKCYNDIKIELKNCSLEKRLLNTYNIPIELQNEIMTQYIKCRPNIHTIILWPKAIDYINQLVKFLQNYGNVYYYHIIDLNDNGLKNIIYNFYDDFTKSHKIDFMNKRVEWIKKNKNDQINKLGVIIFDNINNIDLAGSGAKFKVKMREYLLNLINNNKNIRGSDLIHVNDFFYQSIEYSQILFNQNSVNLLNVQESQRLSNTLFDKSFLIYQSFRKWIYERFSLLQIMRLCLTGGFTLNVFGIRPSVDLDGIIMKRNTNDITEESFKKLVDKYLENPESKFDFSDIGYEDSVNWKPHWTEKNKQHLAIFNVNNMADFILDPKYHLYYCGIKINILVFELARKYMRLAPKDFSDLIIMYFKFKNIVNNQIMLDDNMKFRLPSYSDINSVKYQYNEKTFKFIQILMKKKYLPDDYKDISINIIKSIIPLQNTKTN